MNAHTYTNLKINDLLRNSDRWDVKSVDRTSVYAINKRRTTTLLVSVHEGTLWIDHRGSWGDSFYSDEFDGDIETFKDIIPL